MDSSKRHRIGSLAALATAAAAMAVCLSMSTLAYAQDDSFDEDGSPEDGPAIGLVLPLSGDYAQLGKQVAEAARMAAGEVGVRVIERDTEATPVGAARAVRELAEDDSIVAVLGPIGRRESRAAAQIAERKGVPLFALSNAPELDQTGRSVFRVRPSPGEQAAGLAEEIRKHRGDEESAAILFPETTYGRRAALGFAGRFVELGGRITAVASYPEETSDFRKPLDEIVARRARPGAGARVGRRRADGDGYLKLGSKPKIDFDILFVPDGHRRVAGMLSFLPGAGLQTGAGGDGEPVQLLGLSGWQGESMEMTGEKAAGAIYADVFAGAADGGRAQDFALSFEEKTGRRPVDLDAEVFDAAWLVSRVAVEVGDEEDGGAKIATTRRRLREAIVDKNDFTGVAGPLGFDESGAPRRSVQLYEFDVDGMVSPYR